LFELLYTPSVPLKPSQILSAKTVNQPDWGGSSGTEGVVLKLYIAFMTMPHCGEMSAFKKCTSVFSLSSCPVGEALLFNGPSKI